MERSKCRQNTEIHAAPVCQIDDFIYLTHFTQKLYKILCWTWWRMKYDAGAKSVKRLYAVYDGWQMCEWKASRRCHAAKSSCCIKSYKSVHMCFTLFANEYVIHVLQKMNYLSSDMVNSMSFWTFEEGMCFSANKNKCQKLFVIWFLCLVGRCNVIIKRDNCLEKSLSVWRVKNMHLEFYVKTHFIEFWFETNFCYNFLLF